MKTIFKFEVAVKQGDQKIKMPKDAQILTVQNQSGIIAMWAKVDTNKEECLRTFQVYGTGNQVNEFDLVYIGTVQINSFVWHIFENK